MDAKFLIFGFFVHVVFLYSIFDIYFTSPLVHGMRSHVNPHASPAKRLVLFSADGLRADKLYEIKSGKSNTPYLRYIVRDVGTYGISHTRVPTESRPGHVAFIAGFYEDVSAVTKGWKENPVEFDSLFNQSRYTWAWGSPDILPMFSKEARHGHIFTEMYPGQSEDFAGKDLTKLDTWVFENVQSFFVNTTKEVLELLKQDGLIFFLHLLGLDTTGHVHKPHSQEYVENLKVVDEGVKKIVDIVEQFFGHDGLTSYVFTSDHGMTDWGSHGAGDPSETETPFVAWGAGINKPTLFQGRNLAKVETNWGLDSLKRIDINQADICPLLAALIGIPIPLQSVGIIPVDVLNTSESFKAQSMFTNVQQVYEQYQVKEKEKRKSVFSFLFTPYKFSTSMKEDVDRIKNLIKDEHYTAAINESISLITTTLDGIQYYHQYDINFLGASIALSFLGWLLLMVLVLLEEHTNVPQSPMVSHHPCQGCLHLTLKIVGIFVPFAILVFLAAQSKPISYYFYCLLPFAIFDAVLKRCSILLTTLRYLKNNGLLLKSFAFCPLAVLSLEVVIFSFTHRQLISVGLVAMAAWKLLDNSRASNRSWIVSCLLASLFPLLPTVGLASNYLLVYFSAALTFCLSSFFVLKIFRSGESKERIFDFRLQLFQASIIIVSSCILWWFASNRRSNSSPSSSAAVTAVPLLSTYFHIMSWLILASSFLLPLLCSTKVLQRIFSIMLAFFSPYLLLSIAHESLFYLVLCVLLISWMRLETGLSLDELKSADFKREKFIERKLKFSDVRCSYFFIFFLLMSFFGTGNIASINSFDPTSVLCFVTVFSPFVMGGLMLYKILILFLLVSSCFYATQVVLDVPKNGFFLLVLIISDFMALHFFFMVQNNGSWLEIGMTISHYVIVMALILFLFILLSISKFLTEYSISSSNKKRKD